MALTATAPPSVRDEILQVVPRALITQGSVNQTNITYRVMKLSQKTSVNQTNITYRVMKLSQKTKGRF